MSASVFRNRLRKDGYVCFNLAEELGLNFDDATFAALTAEFDDLPADPHAPGTNRYRRYGRGLVLPWTREFSWIPDMPDAGGAGNGYFQGEHNPEYAGVVRTLPELTASSRKNVLLREIVEFDFAQTYWDAADSAWPLHVGVHLIRLSVDNEGSEAISSPNELHQDGEPFVFAHLVYRRNVFGGRNVIAKPEERGRLPEEVSGGQILTDFELTEPLASYSVEDAQVSHYVSPVRKGPHPNAGERAVVLVDFTPTRQQI